MAIQKTGATIAVGEILRQAFDRRARDAGLVELVGVAADDLRHRLAAGVEAVRFERGRDVGDMAVQASLRDRACWQRAPRPRCRTADAASRLDEERKHADDGEQDQQRASNARGPPRLRIVAVSRLSARSSHAIRRPIQVTGWPIARSKLAG